MLVLISPNFVDSTTMPVLDQGSVSVYPGAGDGTLGPPTSFATGDFPQDLVVADLDGDGWLDVATGADDDDAIAILVNDGSGALLPRRLVPLDDAPFSLAAGDLDGDGTVDLVANRSRHGDVAILRNDGRAGFATPEVYAIQSEELALGDADGDGVLDLYDATFWPHVVLQEAGRLVAPTPISDVGADRVTLADLDGDGYPDAILGDGLLLGGGGFALLRGGPDGGFAPFASSTTSTARSPIAVGDIDGDGDIDLVYAGIGTIVLRRNHGDGTFAPEEPFSVDSPGAPAPALADLDGDGDLDLVVAFGLELPGAVQVYWNDGHGAFRSGPTLTAGGDPSVPVVGSITGSERPDIVVPNRFDGTLSVFQGHADGSFTRFATLSTPGSPTAVLIADVTQDGRPDLIAGGLGPSTTFSPWLRIYPGLDHGLGAPIALPTSTAPSDLAVADLDSDGRRDLLAIGGPLAFYRTLPGGGFAPPVAYAGAQSSGLAVRDQNGDFRTDLVVVSQLPNRLSILTNRCLSQQ